MVKYPCLAVWAFVIVYFILLLLLLFVDRLILLLLKALDVFVVVSLIVLRVYHVDLFNHSDGVLQYFLLSSLALINLDN